MGTRVCLQRKYDHILCGKNYLRIPSKMISTTFSWSRNKEIRQIRDYRILHDAIQTLMASSRALDARSSPNDHPILETNTRFKETTVSNQHLFEIGHVNAITNLLRIILFLFSLLTSWLVDFRGRNTMANIQHVRSHVQRSNRLFYQGVQLMYRSNIIIPYYPVLKKP
jgi:hypothetical protein